MSLQKQLVHLNMTGGIEQGTDSFITLPSKLVELQNGIFDDKNTVVRRGGLTTGGGGYDKARNVRMHTYRGRALVEDVTGHWWLNVDDLWPAVGTKLNTAATTTLATPRLTVQRKMVGTQVAPARGVTIALNDYDYAVDTATNTALVAYTERVPNSEDTQVVVKIVNLTTGDSAYSPYTIKTAGTSWGYPRVIFNSSAATPIYSVFVASCVTSGSSDWGLYKYTFVRTTGAYSTSGVLASVPVGSNVSLANVPLFDASYNPAGTGSLTVAWYSYSVNWYLNLQEYTNGNTAGASISYAISAFATKPVKPVCTSFVYSAQNHTVVFYADHASGGSLYTYDWNITTASGSNAALAAAPSGYYWTNYSACESEGDNLAVVTETTDSYILEASLTVGVLSKSLASYSTCSVTAPYSSSTQSFGFSHLYSRICYSARSGDDYLTAVLGLEHILNPLSSTTPVSMFLVDLADFYRRAAGATSADPLGVATLARFGDLECGFNKLRFYQKDCSLFGTSFICPSTGDYSSAGGFIDSVVSYGLVTWADSPFFTQSSATSIQLGAAEINDICYLAGGCPQVFDGATITEAGFNHAPQWHTLTLAPAASATGLTGPFTTGESYSFCCTYEWRDAKGNLHQSPPSIVLTQSAAFSGSNLYLDLAVCDPLTNKQGVRKVIWRTLNGIGAAGPFYRAISPDTGLPLSDASIGTTATDTLYTTGDVLESEPLPACRDIEVFQNRLFFSGMLDSQVLGFTSQVDQFFAPTYSSLLSRRVHPKNGRIVTARELYGRLVVLCENAVGMLSGSGPSPTGDNDSYSDIDILVKNIGCMWQSPRSAVSVNEGVWFQGNHGLRLFTPNGQLAQAETGLLGSEIDSSITNTQPVCAVVGPAKEQVWFYTYNATTYGTLWAWSQAFRQWSQFVNISSVALDVVYDTNYGYTFGGSDILFYSDTYFRDDEGSTFSLIIKTPWLSFAGIQGFQRLYKLMLTGLNTDASVAVQTVTIKAAYNFGQSLSTLVSSDVTPATGGLIQIQHHFATQKCEAIQLQIEIKPKNNDAGKFRLSDITLQVGVKEGLYKLPSGSRI